MHLLLLIMLTATTSFHQPIPEKDLSAYKTNKSIPAVIAKNVLTALSHYPELQQTPINFVFKKDIKKSVMQAQPVFTSIIKSRNKRKYQINISAMFKLMHAAIPIHQIPDEIMIGWIGHELGHIMDFEQKSNLSLIGFGISYVFSEKFVQNAERVADTYAVTHGLGHYIIATKHYILDNTELPQAYKDKIARLYLSPDDIVEQVRKLEEEKKNAQK